MKKLVEVGLAALMLVALAGCSAMTPNAGAASEQPPSTPAPTPTPTPTPTIDPGPVELSATDAATRYLQIVCPMNIARRSMSETYAAWDTAYAAGGAAPTPEQMKPVAGAALEATYNSVVLFDDPYFTWPSNVSSDIPVIRDATLADVSVFDSLVNASSWEQTYGVVFADAPAASTSAQEVRLSLGISPDTTASCVGFETGHEVLLAEKVERDDKLAAQIDQPTP